MEDKYLCFIRLVGNDINGMNEYEFMFSSDIDNVWGEDWDVVPCCLCNDLVPDENDYDVIRVLKTNIDLSLVQDSCCFGMQDALDGIVALGYENILGYDSYPDEGRLVLHYGISYDECERLLADKNLVFEDE